MVENLHARFASSEEEEEDDTPDANTIEMQLTGAVGLLRECMVMLGFFGDDNLAEELSDGDRQMMAETSERIREFVSEIEENE